MQKISCSIYTDQDELVLRKATEFGLPLIGDGAVELNVSSVGLPFTLPRSNNDFDFLSTGIADHAEFQLWLEDNIKSDKVKVDVYVDTTITPKLKKELETTIDGILTMKPEYLIKSKLKRFSAKDKSDILDLLKMTDADTLEHYLEELGISDKMLDNINSLIEE